MVKRRKFALLCLEGDRSYEKAHDFWVNQRAFHVIEIFMHYLPRIDLDGSRKLTIFFKEIKEHERQYMKNEFQGVSWYYVDKAEIEKHRRLKRKDDEEYYLNIIVDTLKAIARTDGRPNEISDIIDKTAQTVMECGFELTMHIKKLSKTSADRQFRANVYRHISRLGESWYVEIKDKDKNITRHGIDLLKKPTFISQTGVFVLSRWEGGRFIVTDRFGKVTAEVDTNNSP